MCTRDSGNVSPNARLYIHICIYTYVYVCVYVPNASLEIREMSGQMRDCIYIYVYTHMYMYIHLCIYTYVYVCVYEPNASLEIRVPRFEILEREYEWYEYVWHDSSMHSYHSYSRSRLSTLETRISRDISFAKEPCKRDDILQKRPISLNVNVYHDFAFIWNASLEKWLWGGCG